MRTHVYNAPLAFSYDAVFMDISTEAPRRVCLCDVILLIEERGAYMLLRFKIYGTVTVSRESVFLRDA